MRERRIPFASELEFTTHNSKDIEHRAFPTQGVVIGFGAGGAMAHAGDLDWGKLLHGSQGITVHRSIPTEGSVEITDRIAGMWDKGEGRNAIIDTEATAVDTDSGDVLFELRRLGGHPRFGRLRWRGGKHRCHGHCT